MSSLRGQRTTATDDGSVQAPLASWYAQGFTDGFGDRLLMFDNAATGPLELLRVRPDFAFLPDFESELRARHERLAAFSHPNFALARAVNHLENGEGLTVVSAHVPGTRLAELFRSKRPHAGMHPASVRWALGELVTALAELHRQDPSIAHGALGPDRIVITADRHLVITDYIFGSALPRVRLPADRLWKEFGLVPSPSPRQVAPDQRSDIVQLALLIMSLVLGRAVTPAEFPSQLSGLLDEFAAASDRRAPDATPLLSAWLQQALAPGGFQSAVEAELALMLPPALAFTGSSSVPPRPGLESGRASTPSRHTAEPARLDPRLPDSRSSEVHRTNRARRPRMRALAVIAAGLALVAVVEGLAIVGLMGRTTPSAGAARLTIESPTPGDTILVDGREVGVTPLEVPITSATHSLRIVSYAPTLQPGAVLAVSGVPAAVDAAPSVRPDGPRPSTGGIRINSVIPVQIVEGSRVLGSSANGPIFATPGSHQWDLINNELGIRSRQTVQIVAGKVGSVSLVPPNGTLSVNAQPWAQVWIDGKQVGDTPLGNLSVTVGEHELLFRHPQLGERRQKVVVQAGTITRISATFTPAP